MSTRVERLAGPVRGSVVLPGDKSLSHRALMFSALCRGESRIRNLGTGADNKATRLCLRALGVEVVEAAGEVIVRAPEALKSPSAPLDCMNSGTTMRLLTGLLAGVGVEATLVGDESLQKRPMRRVQQPLSLLGAAVDTEDGHAPVRISRRQLKGARVELHEPSAQVKSAVILAALFAEGETRVREPELTRDHTERWLQGLGFALRREGEDIVIAGGSSRGRGCAMWVPGDPSSAAFWAVLAACSKGSVLRIVDVSLNPTRLGFVHVLRRMGARIDLVPRGEAMTEPWGEIVVYGADRLTATVVEGHEARMAIDELVVLAVAMATAEGTSVVRGAADLKNKESDRIAATAAMVRAAGILVETHDDGFAITGGKLRFGEVDSVGDHRIALAAAVMGSVGQGVSILGFDSAGVSYSTFLSTLNKLVAPAASGAAVTVAIDGPAGAGKSTVSKALADRLGFHLVDTGAIYRALTVVALERQLPIEDEVAMSKLAAEVRYSFEFSARGQHTLVDGADVTDRLRTPEVSRASSIVSQHKGVRQALLAVQRELASRGGVVLEGRDIGTVVCPNADVKFFLHASDEERARRRSLELRERGILADLSVVLSEIRDRDERDRTRDIAPLVAAPDAVWVDSTSSSIEHVLQQMMEYVSAKSEAVALKREVSHS